MSQLLQFFTIVPLAGFLLSLLLPRKKEKIISQVTLAVIGFHLTAVICFLYTG
jgi:NADH-quinone oxidoreductase subunit L